MRVESFKQKHGLSVKEFIDTYVIRIEFEKPVEEAAPVLNTAKTYNRLRDLPLTSIKRDDPELYNRIVRLITIFEEKIEWYKKYNRSWYDHQIAPFL